MKIRSFLTSLALLAVAFSPAVAQDYLGVVFEPYVGNWTGSPQPNPPAFNSYTLEQVQAMLQTVRPSFDHILTPSAGYASNYSNTTPWNKVDSDWMIGIAAANINAAAGQKVLDVAQGIYQQVFPESEIFNPLMDLEVKGALTIAQNANSVFPETVTKLVFTNDFLADAPSAVNLTALLKKYTAAAHTAGLQVGVRSLSFGQLNNQFNSARAQFAAVVQNCDFILCNLYPSKQETIAAAVNDVAAQYAAIVTAVQAINPNTIVMIGATGWPSQGVSLNNTTNTLANEQDYFNGIRAWANLNQVTVYFFEAVDEPWRVNITAFGDSLSDGPKGANSHYGLWFSNPGATGNFGNLTAKFPLIKLAAQPPGIIHQPENKTVVAPAAASFAVLAADATPVTYQWQVSANGGTTFTNLINGPGIVGATTATLTIKPTSLSQSGAQLRCVLTDGTTQTISAVAHLVVNVQPAIVTSPGNVTVLAPAPANFTVAATGSTLSFQWQIAASGTAPFVNLANGNAISGAGSPTLSINPTIGSLDGSLVRCVVSNVVGNVISAPAHLTVNTPPSIVIQPASFSVPPGSQATLSVVAVGTPPLAYQWKKGSVVVSGVSANLTLDNVGSDSAGSYTVTIKNNFGTVTSNAAIFLVGVLPTIATPPTAVTVTASASANFTVVAEGTGPSTYQWQLAAQGSRVFNNLSDGGSFSGTATANLVINPTSAKLNGAQVRCLVTNVVGNIISAPAVLTVH